MYTTTEDIWTALQRKYGFNELHLHPRSGPANHSLVILLLAIPSARKPIKSPTKASSYSASQVDFSGRGSTPDVAATISDGPVAVFSPRISPFEHPLHAHFPSAQGQAPVFPPH